MPSKNLKNLRVKKKSAGKSTAARSKSVKTKAKTAKNTPAKKSNTTKKPATKTQKKRTFSQLSKKQVIEALVSTNGLISLAARKLNCSPQALYAWRDRDKDVEEAIINAREEMVDLAEYGLKNRVLAESEWAIGFTLRTLGKDRGYVEKQEITAEVETVELTLDEWRKKAASRREQAEATAEKFADE